MRATATVSWPTLAERGSGQLFEFDESDRPRSCYKQAPEKQGLSGASNKGRSPGGSRPAPAGHQKPMRLSARPHHTIPQQTSCACLKRSAQAAGIPLDLRISLRLRQAQLQLTILSRSHLTDSIEQLFRCTSAQTRTATTSGNDFSAIRSATLFCDHLLGRSPPSLCQRGFPRVLSSFCSSRLC